MSTTNPPVVALLNPDVSLVLCLGADGSATVSKRTLQEAGGYSAQTLGDLPKMSGTMSYTFEVKEPHAAFYLDTNNEWQFVWDEEIASVLGGPVFPFGSGPVGASGNFDPKIQPRRSVTGQITLDEKGVTVTRVGEHCTITSRVPAGVPSKYLSLWLSNGAVGVLRCTNWGGKDVEFRSA